MAEEAEGETGSGDAWVEAVREDCEPEHHWRHRREFLLRNAEGLALPLEDAELRHLLSLSMVWANHVFLGCRYPPQVMEKVMDMAAGITVTNAPTHTLRDELVAKKGKKSLARRELLSKTKFLKLVKVMHNLLRQTCLWKQTVWL